MGAQEANRDGFAKCAVFNLSRIQTLLERQSRVLLHHVLIAFQGSCINALHGAIASTTNAKHLIAEDFQLTLGMPMEN
jgi:hypothetical protein